MCYIWVFLSSQAAVLCLFFSTSFTFAGLSVIFLEITNGFLIVSIVALGLEGGEETGSILGFVRMATTLSLMLAPTVSGGIQSTVLSHGGPLLLGSSVAALGVLIALSMPATITKAKRIYQKKED